MSKGKGRMVDGGLLIGKGEEKVYVCKLLEVQESSQLEECCSSNCSNPRYGCAGGLICVMSQGCEC